MTRLARTERPHGPRNGLAMQRNSMRDLDHSCGGLLPLIAPLEREPAARDDRRDVWLTRGEIRTASLAARRKHCLREKAARLSLLRQHLRNADRPACRRRGQSRRRAHRSVARRRQVERSDRSVSTGTRSIDAGHRRETARSVGSLERTGARSSRARALSNGSRETPGRRRSTSIPPCNCFFPPRGPPAVRNMCGSRATRLSPTPGKSPRRWPSMSAASASPICRCTIPTGSQSSRRIWRPGAEFIW